MNDVSRYYFTYTKHYLRTFALLISRYMWLCLCLGLSTLLQGCHSLYRQDATSLVDVPEQWQASSVAPPKSLTWSSFIQSPELNALIKQAIQYNPALGQSRRDVMIAKAALARSNMRYIPELDTRFNATRRQSTNALGSSNINNDFRLTADLSYELNIWGQVSDAKRSAAFQYAERKADHEANLRATITQVGLAWARVIENQQLVALDKIRFANLEKNLDIIEGGYRSGINRALEVYLSRNDVERERSRVIQNQQNLADSRRALSSLLGQFPSATFHVSNDFPDTALILPTALPSEILTRRPDLQAAWLRILRQNADVAIAHKARFPSLRLTASAGRTSDELSTLLDGNNPLWSVSASLIQPLLASGRLKFEAKSARLRLEQFELRYIATVHAAFSDIESALEKQTRLQHQYEATLQSRDNAVTAEKLSFEQYLKGLVSYTTVLDSQRRAVDAEVQLIALQRQKLVNKIQLHEALVGHLDILEDFAE